MMRHHENNHLNYSDRFHYAGRDEFFVTFFSGYRTDCKSLSLNRYAMLAHNNRNHKVSKKQVRIL